MTRRSLFNTLAALPFIGGLFAANQSREPKTKTFKVATSIDFDSREAAVTFTDRSGTLLGVIGCLACAEKRQHTAEEWANHPDAGKGTSKQ